jgi:hypothetical protein
MTRYHATSNGNVPFTVEEEMAWDARMAEEAAKQPQRAADELSAKIDSLWRAADNYTSGFISGVAIGILTIGVLQQKPKALAVSAWSSQVWAEYYRRKAAITVNYSPNLDFSTIGTMPYSVPELQAEIGL